MADYAWITNRGVIVPDTADLRADVEGEWKEAFGQDLVVTPDTPQGVLVTAETEARDAVARNNADLANQINPDIAGGIFLDAIWRLTRGSRRPATRSLITGAILGGVANTIVPAGSLAAVEGSGDQFRTTATVIIDSTGTTTANLESVEFGEIAAGPGQLVNVATAVLGWETITNPTSAALGRLEESDIASRRRRRQTLALQGASLPEAIMSRVSALEGVRSIAFRENIASTSQTIDGILMLPHSVYVAVDGGDPSQIANALLESKSIGAAWNGNTMVDIIDPYSGQTSTVLFEMPAGVQVFARVTAKFNGLDGQTIIPDAIMEYAGGELEGDNGFSVGSSINPFELAGAINQVEPRIFVSKVELSTDGITYSTNEIPISLQQVARISPSSVTVVQI